LIIVLLIGTYSLITFNKENLAKRKSEEVKRIYAVELEKRIEQLAATNLELDRHRRIEKFVATGRMASTMAHEIKNPLNNISLALEQLGEVIGKQQDSAMLLEIIKRNTTRINVLVTDLLNSTRYLQLKFVTVSINDIIDQALEIAKDRLKLQHVDIVKNYDSDICKVTVDPDKIGIAFLNIIINAVEAMEGRPGKIEISTEAKENSCYITIKDNGNGMPPEVLSKLFEPFHSTKSKGTGLGLTNSQNIILNHGGLINVESE
jgi:signal transduction histidine kinase